MQDKLKKAGRFVVRHNEFFIGLAVGMAVPVVRAKLNSVQLPVTVAASASIDATPAE